MRKYGISIPQDAQKSAGQGPVQSDPCLERGFNGMTSQLSLPT